jgi:hypothetical protein
VSPWRTFSSTAAHCSVASAAGSNENRISAAFSVEIDGADRNAVDPIRMKIGLGQCFIDPGLVRTKRTASLEDEGDALERRTWPRLRGHIAGFT